jgi:hypothetical protein
MYSSVPKKKNASFKKYIKLSNFSVDIWIRKLQLNKNVRSNASCEKCYIFAFKEKGFL